MEEQDSIQEKIHNCLNCYAPLINKAYFCYKCGQKNKAIRLTLKDLFSQFFDTVFNLDSKIFRTLGAVLIPGKLTNAFLNGQRQKYYHPIRLFLVLIVIFLAGLNYQNNMPIATKMKKGRIDKLEERKRLMGVLNKGINSISEKTDQQVVLESLDTLSSIFYRNSGKRVDSININREVKVLVDFDFNIAVEDFEKYSSKEILDIYEVKGFYKRMVVQQKVKMLKSETSFMPFLLGKVTWMIFFVLLLLSLVFKLLYLKSDFLYLEHLIFGIHLHSFFFIVLSILTLFSVKMAKIFLPFILFLMAIYFFIALSRVYKQSFFMTSLKFILVLICYFFLSVFGFAFTVVGSFLIF